MNAVDTSWHVLSIIDICSFWIKNLRRNKRSRVKYASIGFHLIIHQSSVKQVKLWTIKKNHQCSTNNFIRVNRQFIISNVRNQPY